MADPFPMVSSAEFPDAKKRIAALEDELNKVGIQLSASRDLRNGDLQSSFVQSGNLVKSIQRGSFSSGVMGFSLVDHLIVGLHLDRLYIAILQSKLTPPVHKTFAPEIRCRIGKPPAVRYPVSRTQPISHSLLSLPACFRLTRIAHHHQHVIPLMDSTLNLTSTIAFSAGL